MTRLAAASASSPAEPPFDAQLVVLAHAGGVPEVVALGLPVLALVVFALVERRARRREREEEDDR
jgi:hypothetical protein